MERETSTARIVQRIATELGVPVASFYRQGGLLSSDSEAMQRAVAALLIAFTAVHDPKEHQHSVAVLIAEAERLRDLPDCNEKVCNLAASDLDPNLIKTR